MSKTIELTLEEIGLGAQAGLKQFNKKYYKIQSNRNKLESHLCGKLGEIAYSKHTGHKINLEHYEYAGDGGIDAEDGVQIKTVTWTGPNKQLKVNREEHISALKDPGLKGYVLVSIDLSYGGEKIDLIGYISKENFEEKHHTEDKWGSNLLLVNENQLDFYYNNI